MTEEKKEDIIEETSKKSEEVETISVSKAEWDSVLKTVDELKNPGRPVEAKKTNKHVGFLRSIDGKIITKVLKTWQEPSKTKLNFEDTKRLFGKFVVLDGDKLKEVDHDYLNLVSEEDTKNWVLIKERKKKEVTKSQGFFTAENPNPAAKTIGYADKYNDYSPGMVEGVVTTVEETLVVEMLEGDNKGETFEVNADILNI